MNYLLWCLPALTIALAIASGRVVTTTAAGIGLLLAFPVVWFAAPTPLDGSGLGLALARGAWVGANLAPYILGGLFFWGVVHGSRSAPAAPGASATASADAPHADDRDARTRLVHRRQAFHAGFVVGPFAEALTGFGVGMLGTLAMVRGIPLRPRHTMVLVLLSQTLIPWGAMGSGTLLAATFARMPATDLAMLSVLPCAVLSGVWLLLFRRVAAAAGLDAPAGEWVREIAWLAVCFAALALATRTLGPEVAMLAAYGPLILLRGLMGMRHAVDAGAAAALAAASAASPERATTLRMQALRLAPHLVLIALLVTIRLVPALRDAVMALGRLKPYPDLPAFSPLFHGGACMLWVGLATVLLRRDTARLRESAQSAWATGRHATLTVLLFAMLAELLSASGISQGLAAGVLAALDRGALLAMPLAAGLFGVLSNSTNPSSTLFMPAQVALATQAAMVVPLAATLLHVTACTLCIASPVRMSIAANLAWGRGEERAVYALLLPYLAGAVGVMAVYGGWVLWGR